MDWHKILVAYIAHVEEVEGVTFYPSYHIGGTAVERWLNDEERAALTEVVKEALVKSNEDSIKNSAR